MSRERESPGRGDVLDPPLVSVVICTRDRARHLRAALESVVRQPPPSFGREVVVVDNGSSDDTRDVALAFAPDGVRYVLEPATGLCHARNAGWRAARGRYVAYLDDDAVAEPGWLEAVADAFRRTPEPGVAGGRVQPIWEGERPDWLSDELALALTVVDWSREPRPLPDVDREWLVGANMALPRALLERVGGFHPALDRSGTKMLSSGDVHLQKKVMGLGYVNFYQPSMAVRHLVPASRVSQEWFRGRYFWQGVSDALMELIDEAPGPLDRVRRALRRSLRLLASPRRLLCVLLPTSDPRRFTLKCLTLIDVGHVAGLLGRAGR